MIKLSSGDFRKVETEDEEEVEEVDFHYFDNIFN